MMAAQNTTSNPLVTSKAPDAPLNVQLHPLVLLTISDYITRHHLRNHQTPVVGAIIGQQNGRNFTLEHAFECKLAQQDGDMEMVVDSEWFAERLEQYRDVHKAPALDLVAMFAMGPLGGPLSPHVAMLQHVQQLTGSDGVMLLLFHGELVHRLQGGKLPISLWESVQEQEGEQAQVRFRELSFEVETGEAEMIGVDFVAKGGGNATAVTIQSATANASTSPTASKKGKAKAIEDDSPAPATTSTDVLSPEDEELIASLTAKTNAIRMLNHRLGLIRSYLHDRPASYLTDAACPDPPPETTNHNALRSINAMLSRLPLLESPPAEQHPTSPSPTLPSAGAKEKEDVHLTSLLAALTRSVHEAQSMGAKFAIVQKEKATKDRVPAYGGGRGGGGGRMMGGDLMGLTADGPGGF